MRGAPSRPRGRVQPERGLAGLALQAFLLLALVSAVLLGPRIFEGQTALRWTRYHASGRSDLRPAELARQTARWAGRSIELLAPLPGGAEAASLAVGVARDLEAQYPKQAAALCLPLERTLAQVAAVRWRSLGLPGPLAECQAARARAEAAAQPGSASP